MSGYKGLSDERLKTLIDRYGSGVEEIAAYMHAGPDELLTNYNGYSRREIEFITRNERVVHLDDIILRRTLIGMLGEVSLGLLEELAMIISPILEWSQKETEAEVERTVQLLQRVHGVTLAKRSK
jgi:glycerol-3-phosphate dehydrogenase